MNNLILRATTGAVYVALIVCSIIFGSAWGFAALCTLFAILATIEFGKLSNPGATAATLLADVIGAMIITATPFCVLSAGSPLTETGTFAIAATAFAIYMTGRLTAQLFITGQNPLTAMLTSLSGQLYIALPLSMASFVYITAGPQIVLAMFIMIWLNDTGAYLVGSQIGRRRLFERISPKKSWEGFFGGMIFCIGGALLIKYTFGAWAPACSTGALCVFAVLTCLFATLGDLVESLIKRTLKVKDSGRMMPGHGGILDRIDSLLFVAPMTLCFITIIFLINY